MLCESLERRTLFAVTVSQGYPGVYDITGDASADEIIVTVSQNDYTFTLNGSTYYEVMYIAVNGLGGEDTISVTSSDGPGYIAASIVGGEDDDAITIGIDGGVWGGAGNDRIDLTDSYRGEAWGESGDDIINISGACVDAEIRGGDGDDLIDCSTSIVDVVAHGGFGNDTLIGSDFADQLYGDAGNDYLVGGNGNDEFYVDGGDTVVGGNGSDFLYTNGSTGTTHDCEHVA